MKCPHCYHFESKVLDSRITEEGASIRRRRMCLKCERRFTTYERVDETPLMVVKKDKRREPFDRQKVLAGILKACEKRPVSLHQAESVADEIEKELRNRGNNEVPAKMIGSILMEHLKRLDPVAYVRFASVYKEFKDVGKFLEELKILETDESSISGVPPMTEAEDKTKSEDLQEAGEEAKDKKKKKEEVEAGPDIMQSDFFPNP